MRARRAFLYTPGIDFRKCQKASSLAVDTVCLDLEDGVAINSKEEARKTVVKVLNTLDFGGTERLVRINAVGSGLEADDLTAILPAMPNGIVIPKVTSAEQVQWVASGISDIERAEGLSQGFIYLLILVETAQGLVNLREIAGADPRLKAIIFGAEDFARDIGATRTQSAWEVFYARSAIVTYAAAFNLQAIDMVSVDFRDMEKVKLEARQGAEMGFGGKQIIHPIQVQPVQDAFTPGEAEIAAARQIVEAFNKHQAAGIGTFSMDGKMVDMPIVQAAERVLARASFRKDN